MKDEPTWKQQCREYSQLRATKGVPITGYDDGGEDGFETIVNGRITSKGIVIDSYWQGV
jgi:hypothetical protein